MIRQRKPLSVSSFGSTSESSSSVSLLKHLSHSASSAEIPNYRNGWRRPIHKMDFDKVCTAMEIGHKVRKISLLKRSEPVYKRLFLNRETGQIVLAKWDSSNTKPKNGSEFLDLRVIREVQTVDYKLNQMLIQDKWKKDKEIAKLNAELILAICYGSGFNLNYWIILFETKETCQHWSQGIYHLVMETKHASHFVRVERWFQKHFHILLPSDATEISMKQMKPFIQTTLQCKLDSKELQELCDGQINFDAFVLAVKSLQDFEHLFDTLFDEKIQTDCDRIFLDEFHKFLLDEQQDELAENKQQVKEFLRTNLSEIDLKRDTTDPFLTKHEFIDFLFSKENSVFDPVNLKVVHNMNQPLTNYWMATSHNTYLTGDQLKSESALEAYSRCLLWGCRCIELDCWDGRKNKKDEPIEVVIYHGYTMTSKVTLRDVLYTIRHYAFITSDFPVILSIEDRCSVPFQRLMAVDFQEILGDLLVTTPVSRSETCLPSPAALRNKIVLKHKKLDAEVSTGQNFDEDDSDILYKNCVKKGILNLRNNTNYEWTKHVFVLFADKLCYISTPLEEGTNQSNDPTSEETGGDESSIFGFGIEPEELHVTEEWFHGKIEMETAQARLMEHKENGMFLVRESGTFIGDYTLSFFQGIKVRHVHIKTALVRKQKQYFFHSNLTKETLYELISFYTKHFLAFEKFKVRLLVPCPQPQPHLNQPWFSSTANKERAEEILNAVNEEGAFLIRHSSTDPKVFVLSLRADGEIWHYRLKRDGRIFVVNQTVFENLNRIVEFYSNNDLIKDVRLKIPANEKDLIQSADKENLPGTYKDINYLDKEVEALTLKAHQSDDPNALNFPANVIIKIIKKNPDLWKGKYDNQVGFFPPEFVTNVPKTDEVLNHVVIELVGTVVEKWKTNKPNAIRIVCPTGQWSSNEWVIAAEDSDDMEDWFLQMSTISKDATNRIHDMRKKESNSKIALEMSNLVVYCKTKAFNPDFVNKFKFYEMCSYSETKQEKLAEKGLLHFNIRQLSRSYPQGSRVTSTNYSPIPMWNHGCQMVALNYQTGDKPMQLNQGKFIANGKCGFVLKPAYLLDKNCSPNNLETIKGNFPIILKLAIIAGRQLSSKDKNKGICSPFVEVEISGFPFDDKTERTSTVSSNGLNPIWQETFSFTINCPEIALIRFNVEDGDFLGAKSDPFIGQAVFPVDCLRNGFRSVRLLNQFSEPLELSSLLVHVEILPAGDGADERVLNPHQKLQNGRSVYCPWKSGPAAIGRSISSISTGCANSLENSPVSSPSFLSNQKPAFPRSSPSTESANSPTDKKSVNALKKLFRLKK